MYGDASSPSLNRVNPVEIQSRQIIGDYEIFVLKAVESEDLNTWLEDNGFRPFPEKAFATIDDYLKQNWYFLAAKLTREHDHISAPHPILIEFETNRPVYPMRLTALQGAEVNIELFVIAEAQAVPIGYRLENEYCNTFFYRKISSRYHRNTEEKVYGFKGRKYFRRNMEIGHTDGRKVMWDGCVLTKLTGKVKHKNMKIDLFFTFKNTVPHLAVSYTRGAALDLVSVLGIAVFMIGFPFLVAWNPKTVEKILLLLFICIHIMISHYIHLGKKVETVAIKSEWYNFTSSMYFALSDIELKEDTTDRELIDQLTEIEDLMNPFTKKAVVLEDSPGNITVKRKDGLIESIKLYKWDGTFIYCPLPPLSKNRKEDLGDEDLRPEDLEDVY
jgi:hypothetical protein